MSTCFPRGSILHSFVVEVAQCIGPTTAICGDNDEEACDWLNDPERGLDVKCPIEHSGRAVEPGSNIDVGRETAGGRGVTQRGIDPSRVFIQFLLFFDSSFNLIPPRRRAKCCQRHEAGYGDPKSMTSR